MQEIKTVLTDAQNEQLEQAQTRSPPCRAAAPNPGRRYPGRSGPARGTSGKR